MNKIAHGHPLEVVSCKHCNKILNILENAKGGCTLKEILNNISLSKPATLSHLRALQYFLGIRYIKPRGKRPKWKSEVLDVEKLIFSGASKIKKRKKNQSLYTPELIASTQGLYKTKGVESFRELFLMIYWILDRIIFYSWWPSPILNKDNNEKKVKIKKWRGTPQIAWYGNIIYFGTKKSNINKLKKSIKYLREIGDDLDSVVVLISRESITQDEYINNVEKEIDNLNNDQSNLKTNAS